MGLVCCWFSSLLRGSTPGPLIFLSPQKPIFQNAIRPIKLEKKSDLVECSFLNSILLLLRLWNIDRIVLKNFSILDPLSAIFLWHRSISESDKTCFHFQNCLSPTAFRFHLFSVHKSNPFTLSCIHIILYFITFAFLLDFGITQYLLPEGGGGSGEGSGGGPEKFFCEGYHVVFGGMERRSVFERGFIENWPQWEGERGEGVIIILQSLRGDQVNFIVTAKILRPPHPRR